MRRKRCARATLLWTLLVGTVVACGGEAQDLLPTPDRSPQEQDLSLVANSDASALPPAESTRMLLTPHAGPKQDRLPTATPSVTAAPGGTIRYATNGNPCPRTFYLIGPAAGGFGQSLLAAVEESDPVLFVLGEEGDGAGSPAFSPDGRLLLTSNSHLRLWDAASGASLGTVGEDTGFSQPAFSPDGGLITALHAEIWPPQSLYFWEADTESEPREIDAGGWIRSYQFGPGGRMVAMDILGEDVSGFGVADMASGEVRLIAGAHSATDGDIQGSPRRAFAFSPDGRLLATADGRIVQLWDTGTGEEVHRLQGEPATPGNDQSAMAFGHASRVFDLAFSPDGQVLLTAGGDWALRLWDVARGEYLGCFEAPIGKGSFYRVTFSPDGRQFAASMLADDYSEHVYVWQSESGRLAYEVDSEVLRGAAFLQTGIFDPAGERLLTIAGEDTLLWDAVTGAQVARLQHPGEVSRATFSRDCAALAVEIGSFDEETMDYHRSVWVWDARHPALSGGPPE